MRQVAIFDPSITSNNLGDRIIMEAVMLHLTSLYPHDFFIHIGTHDPVGRVGRTHARRADVAFVGGTNLLCSHWLYHRQWRIGLSDFWRIGHPVLMGVGWQGYQPPADISAAILLRWMLSKRYLHSVRDSYTESHLRAIGIHNVINTGCPTMWDLNEEHCAGIPGGRAQDALITVSFYRPAAELDRQWINLVRRHYRKVYFWPQTPADLRYVGKVTGAGLEVLDPSLKAFDTVLSRPDVDYIGTRLHAGIRAIQHKRRALIIEVDNRAAEIARDTRLPTMRRDDPGTLARWIDEQTPTTISLPLENIARWKAQFNAND